MQAVRKRSLPVAIPATIALAWLIAAVAQLSGSGRLLHHDALIEGGPPLGIALTLFLLAWLVMIAAMMLPSTYPLLRMFAQASANQPRSGVAIAAFVGGYIVVWFAFGALAFGGDVVVHRIVDSSAWLSQHPWVIAGGVLAVAGAFQFTSLKEQCLHKCRLPGTYLMHHYRRGTKAAFDLGFGHGLFCAGCCWALMLIGFASGFASLWWMAALTALMVFEKTARRGRTAVPIAGAVLLAWSVLVLLHPPWLPAALAGVG